MKKKAFVLVAIVGALLVIGQMVWAANDNVVKIEQTRFTQAEHEQHHPEVQAANTEVKDATVPDPQGITPEMMKTMGEGNMTEMMKTMGEGNMTEMMKMMGNGNMTEMMKMMGNGNMTEMMKMMQTPEGKKMMEQCFALQKKE